MKPSSTAKIVLCVLGADRPGIVAAVTKVLADKGCNIEDVDQTLLQGEFAGFFVTTLPAGVSSAELDRELAVRLKSMDLSILIKPFHGRRTYEPPSSEPFVITTMGPDRVGLVAGITEVMARFRVNITNLKAIFRGGTNPHHNVMIYQVEVPKDIDHKAFRAALREKAASLGLDLSLQHRHIFEAIHRV